MIPSLCGALAGPHIHTPTATVPSQGPWTPTIKIHNRYVGRLVGRYEERETKRKKRYRRTVTCINGSHRPRIRGRIGPLPLCGVDHQNTHNNFVSAPGRTRPLPCGESWPKQKQDRETVEEVLEVIGSAGDESAWHPMSVMPGRPVSLAGWSGLLEGRGCV